MRKFFLSSISFIFFLILPLFLQGQNPKILVSVDPYAYLVEKIAGSTVDIQVVVPPNTNVHLYEPTPKEVEKMVGAHVWVRLGDPFEKKLAQLFQEKNPSLVTIELWKGIALLGHEGNCGHDHEDEKDFHLWLSPKNGLFHAEMIAKSLIQLYPKHGELYAKNLKILQDELQDLDQKISSLLKPLQGKAILVSHPAFGYFCKDYGLVQIPIEFEGKEPRPKQLTQILKEVEKFQIKTVLTQAQYSNKGAEIIAKKLLLPIYLVDPYSKDYSNNLFHIAKVIAHSSS